MPNKTQDLLLSPLVLTSNLIFLLWSEVILNVEGLSDFFWRFALDHVGNSLASNVKESLDIEIVGRLKDGHISNLGGSTRNVNLLR